MKERGAVTHTGVQAPPLSSFMLNLRKRLIYQRSLLGWVIFLERTLRTVFKLRPFLRKLSLSYFSNSDNISLLNERSFSRDRKSLSKIAGLAGEYSLQLVAEILFLFSKSS